MFANNFCSEFHEDPTNVLVADYRSKIDGGME
jgi:hypothetical protein